MRNNTTRAPRQRSVEVEVTAEVITLPRSNKNYRRKRGGEFVKTLEERRRSELAWLIYCTDGLLGNIKHALLVNAFTMLPKDLKAADRLRALVQLGANEMREHMRKEMPDTNKSRAKRNAR
jgi:hypothetical protein